MYVSLSSGSGELSFLSLFLYPLLSLFFLLFLREPWLSLSFLWCVQANGLPKQEKHLVSARIFVFFFLLLVICKPLRESVGGRGDIIFPNYGLFHDSA